MFPPFIDPTVGLGGGVPAVAPDGETLPRFQNWSLTVQRRLTKNMMLDVSYIGNRGSRLNHHAERAGLDFNMNDPRVLSLGAALLNSGINSPEAQAAGIPLPYPGFNGTVAQALRKYPAVSEHRLARPPDRPQPVPRPRGRPRAAVHGRAPVPHRLHLFPAEEQRRGERAGQRRKQRGRSGPRQLGHGRLRAQPGRHAARGARGLHVGHRVRRLQELDRSEEGPPRRLEPQRNPALRGRQAAADHHGQRHGWAALQHAEAPESHRVRRSGRRRGLRPADATTTSTGPAGRTRVRSRSATRREATGRCAASRSSTRT